MDSKAQIMLTNYSDMQKERQKEYGIGDGEDHVIEISFRNFQIYTQTSKVKRYWKDTGRIVCNLHPQGVNILSLGEFCQFYFDENVRGNHLHMYKTYTTSRMYEKDLARFRYRLFRRARLDLNKRQINIWAEQPKSIGEEV